MDDNKMIRAAMLDGLQQGIRETVAYAVAKFCDPEPLDDSEPESHYSRQALGEDLQKIFAKAQIAATEISSVG